MAFNGQLGGGVDPGVGSPEAAEAHRAGLGDKPPPGPVDPSDRPGCRRTLLSLVAVATAVVALMWLGGELLGPA